MEFTEKNLVSMLFYLGYLTIEGEQVGYPRLNISNRVYIKFGEKYIKLIFSCIAMNLKIFRLKSEMEVQRRYFDILLMPRNKNKGYKAVMIEFKYLKKENIDKLKEKEQEATEQLKEYSGIEQIVHFIEIALSKVKEYCKDKILTFTLIL